MALSPVPGEGSPAATEAAGVSLTIRRFEERLAKDPASPVFASLADAYRKAGRLQDVKGAEGIGMDGRRRIRFAKEREHGAEVIDRRGPDPVDGIEDVAEDAKIPTHDLDTLGGRARLRPAS